MRAAKKRNYYREARFQESEGHPLDDELDRCLRHTRLRKRIIAAQDRVMAALGEHRHLFLRLEELVGNRQIDREEAMFNVGACGGWTRWVAWGGALKQLR